MCGFTTRVTSARPMTLFSFSRLISPHPNTYTCTKRLAECLVGSQYPELPVVIARPAIGMLANSRLLGCSLGTEEAPECMLLALPMLFSSI